MISYFGFYFDRKSTSWFSDLKTNHILIDKTLQDEGFHYFIIFSYNRPRKMFIEVVGGKYETHFRIPYMLQCINFFGGLYITIHRFLRSQNSMKNSIICKNTIQSRL